MMRLASVAALVALGACFERPASPPAATATGATWSSTYLSTGHPLTAVTQDPAVLHRESEVEALVNHHRVSLGLNALESLASVREVSRGHSEHMIAHGFFGHVNPELDGPAVRAALAGLGHAKVGENIAAGYAGALSVFNAWLASEGHRANIEDPDWTHHGVGYAAQPSDPAQYVEYWTHNFIRR